MTRFLIDWWRCMGVWRWPNLLLVGIACWLAVEYEAVATGWTNHGARTFENLRVTLGARGRIEPGEQFEVMLNASGAASMVFKIGDTTRYVELPADENIEFRVVAPDQTRQALILELTDERQNTASWNLGRLYE